MLRLSVARRVLTVLCAAHCFVACVEPSSPGLVPDTGNGPDGALAPRPRGPGGGPLDSVVVGFAPPPITRFTLGGPDSTRIITVGAPVQLRLRGWDATGTEQSVSVLSWVLAAGARATLDTATVGRLTATAPGAVRVGAVGTDSTIWFDLTAVSAPGAARSVALVIQRLAPGASGRVLVSSGIPLPMGALLPSDAAKVRITIGGVEQSIYAQPLASRHPDGSLRSLLVRFYADVPSGAGLVATLDLGAPRAAADIADPGTDRGAPEAVALPSDPRYLLETDLVGATVASSDAKASGAIYARYETDFKSFGDRIWGIDGARWDTNYYDRALIFYAAWIRTGDPVWWIRASQIAVNYRRDYLEANAYVSSPHWSQLEGLEKHYLLTGDEASRKAVLNTADNLYGFVPSSYMTSVDGDSRIAARVLHSQMLAWRLTPPGVALPSGSPNRTWGTRTEQALAKIVAWQAADGSYPAKNQMCNGQLNYMVGQLNDALIKTSDYYLPSGTTQTAMRAQIAGLVTRSADYMWSTQWLPLTRSFQYASVLCPLSNAGIAVGGPTPAPDLNQLIVATYGWVYRQTGDIKYRDAGEAIFAGGVTQAFLSGTKQFNENYTSSFRYFGYR